MGLTRLAFYAYNITNNVSTESTNPQQKNGRFL